jgi:hypothetical protein
MDWTESGKLLLVVGGLLMLMGLGLLFLGRSPALGRLPGDIHLRRGNLSCSVLIGTSLLLSLLLTVVLNLLLRLLRR